MRLRCEISIGGGQGKEIRDAYSASWAQLTTLDNWLWRVVPACPGFSLRQFISFKGGEMPLIGSGTLSRGQNHQYSVLLKGNVTYAVYVRPDRSGGDFDLQTYDQNNNLVQWDEAPDSDALCYVTPRWNGPFQLARRCLRPSRLTVLRR